MPFFCWKNSGGSIRKNGKLTDDVCMFCIPDFIRVDGIGEKLCAEHHESNRLLLKILFVIYLTTLQSIKSRP